MEFWVKTVYALFCLTSFSYKIAIGKKIFTLHKPQNTSPKVLQWKNQEDNEPEKFSATLTSEPRRENKTESEDEKLSGNSGKREKIFTWKNLKVSIGAK